MVNAERTKLMTKAEIFRSREERRAIRINRYDRFDYVTFYMILCFIVFLVGCVVACALVGGMYAEDLLTHSTLSYLVQVAMDGAVICAILGVIFLIIAFWVYSGRHVRAEKKMKHYQAILKEVNHLSEQETAKVWRESEEYKE